MAIVVLTPEAKEQFERLPRPIKARILLMLALTRTSDLNEIRRMFAEY